MKQTLKRGMFVAALISTASFVVACGGGKEEESDPPGFGSIAKTFESPTGTLDETTAADVALAFERSQSGSTASGERENAAPVNAQTTEVVTSCESGNMTVEVESSGEGTYSYNDCCYATCCMNGGGTAYADTSGSAAYTVCATFDVDYTCDSESVGNVSYSYCFGASGYVYAVEVSGDSFVVSGSISNGTGTLEIRGENGTFTCTYTDYTGSCTDSAGGSFSF